MAFICHSGLALSPAQNGQESAIKSLPQQNVAMTKHAFRIDGTHSHTQQSCAVKQLYFSVTTHQLQYDKTFPLFVKGVAARI